MLDCVAARKGHLLHLPDQLFDLALPEELQHTVCG